MGAKKKVSLPIERVPAKKTTQLPVTQIPSGYGPFLEDLKARIQNARIKAALAVNRELVLLYWDIGRRILRQQESDGWGARVVDRLAQDLRRAFPDMRGFSRANLLYMRAFAAAYPDGAIVQQVAGQIPWFHNVVLIESGLYERQGKAVTNFAATLPPPQSDLAQQRLPARTARRPRRGRSR